MQASTSTPAQLQLLERSFDIYLCPCMICHYVQNMNLKGNECPICFGSYEAGQMMRTLPCIHFFQCVTTNRSSYISANIRITYPVSLIYPAPLMCFPLHHFLQPRMYRRLVGQEPIVPHVSRRIRDQASVLDFLSLGVFIHSVCVSIRDRSLTIFQQKWDFTTFSLPATPSHLWTKLIKLKTTLMSRSPRTHAHSIALVL